MAEFNTTTCNVIDGTAKTVICLNIGKKAMRLLSRKIIRCKTPAKALNEILNRYESSSWSGLIQEPNNSIKTEFQKNASEVICENANEIEEYEQHTMRVLAKDYTRLKTLAAFLRISMSLLFFYLITFDEYNSWGFYRSAKREIVITKSYSFSTSIKFLLREEEFVLQTNSPFYTEKPPTGIQILQI